MFVRNPTKILFQVSEIKEETLMLKFITYFYKFEQLFKKMFKVDNGCEA